MNFRLGAGDVDRQPGRRPVLVQFDIPRFLETSPLVKGFSRPLPNTAELNRAVAAYEEDARRGFIQATNVSVSSHVAWTGYTSPTRGALMPALRRSVSDPAAAPILAAAMADLFQLEALELFADNWFGILQLILISTSSCPTSSMSITAILP